MQKQVNNYLLLFLLSSLLSSAQTKLHTRVAPDGSSIEVKWYGPGLINTKGFDLYRKEENTDWKKINKSRKERPEVQDYKNWELIFYDNESNLKV